MPPTHHPPSSSLLRRWLLRVVVPLTTATGLAFALLALAVRDLPISQPMSTLAPALWWSGLLMLLALALVAAASWRIAIRVARPLVELADAIERLGRGESVALQPTGRDGAIDRLRNAVNRTSRRLDDARAQLNDELGRTSSQLAERNAQLETAIESRARLIAAASHDLRQPLYALTLFSSSLRGGEADPDKLARIHHIEECVASLDRLFSELLDLSKIEAGTLKAVPAAIAVDEVFAEVSRNFRMLAEAGGLRLVVRKTDAWVRADRTMFARILNNLVSNALRYTASGGVLVAARRRDDGRIRIDVWDTGCGIAPEYQQRVFEEFFQAPASRAPQGGDRRGLGLGLATVRKLADLMQCTLELASRPDRGTRVSILMPGCPAPAQTTSEPIEAPLDLSGMRVLAIDDDPAILRGLDVLLHGWGCEVRSAADTNAAITALDDWNEPPELVISDLQLPAPETGPKAMHAIAEHYRDDPDHPPFARLLITGETRREHIAPISAMGIPVLFKPVPPGTLREAMLAAVLASRARHAPSADPPGPAAPDRLPTGASARQ